MKLEFKNIIDKHKGSPAIVIAHGSSLNMYRDKLDLLKEKGFIFLDCNEWYCFHKIIPNYWILANSEMTIKNSINLFNKYNITLLYADSVDLTDREWVKNSIKCNYLSYDQRHFNSLPCDLSNTFLQSSGKCCKHIIPDRLTIQEEFKKYTDFNMIYSTGHTVAVHMLSFAILMGCNPIYFIGIDLNYEKGYAMQLKLNSVREVRTDVFVDYKEITLKDFSIINNSAKNINVNIFNLNKDSTFDIFEKGSL